VLVVVVELLLLALLLMLLRGSGNDDAHCVSEAASGAQRLHARLCPARGASAQRV
jgi:hypothetical protein